jgi:predicted phage terminase large subunit-like protein
VNRKLENIIRDYEQHCLIIEQSTSVDINETPADKRKRVKKLEGDYALWFEYYFPHYAKAPCAWFHKRMARLLDDHEVIDLLAEIYRSGAKSVHLDMGTPIWLYFRGKLHFMLLIGQTDPKARKLLSDIQAQLKHNKRIINDYGRRFKYGSWADGDFTTSDGAKFVSASIGQSVRGLREGASRPDYIVVDDVDTKQRCNNDRLSREAYEWVWEDLKGTFDQGEGSVRRFVVANNNFHKNTIINRLKKEFKRINKDKDKEDIEHFVLTVKAVNNLEEFKPAWPEKTSSEYWRKFYADSTHRSFMREFMHTHIQDGTIFKQEMIRYETVPRLNQYDGLVLYGDLSYKNAGDYKALILIGRKGKRFYVLRVFLRRTSRANAAKWLYDIYEEMNLKNYPVRYWIEGLFAQDEFVNDFDAEGDERGYYVPVVADETPKGNKFDRIESMEAFFHRCNVIFNIKYKDDKDFVTLIDDQLLPFEKGSGANDDGPDAMQSGIAKLNINMAIGDTAKNISTGRKKRRQNRY